MVEHLYPLTNASLLTNGDIKRTNAQVVNIPTVDHSQILKISNQGEERFSKLFGNHHPFACLDAFESHQAPSGYEFAFYPVQAALNKLMAVMDAILNQKIAREEIQELITAGHRQIGFSDSTWTIHFRPNETNPQSILNNSAVILNKPDTDQNRYLILSLLAEASKRQAVLTSTTGIATIDLEDLNAPPKICCIDTVYGMLKSPREFNLEKIEKIMTSNPQFSAGFNGELVAEIAERAQMHAINFTHYNSFEFWPYDTGNGTIYLALVKNSHDNKHEFALYLTKSQLLQPALLGLVNFDPSLDMFYQFGPGSRI